MAAAELSYGRRGDGSSQSFGGTPWRRALDIEIGAPLRRVQEALVAGEPVRGAKA